MRKKTILFILSLGLFGSFFIYSCSSDDNAPDEVIEEPEEPEEPKVGIENYPTFNNVFTAFAEGESQFVEDTFEFPTDGHQLEAIKMYVQDICPDRNCDEWDRYANVYVKDKDTDTWFEIARFITPYWVGTELLERGLEFDVTDFKSLLSGETELKIYTETWSHKGRTYSVDFDFIYGETDYKYSAVVPIIQYNKSSIDGVPYGVPHEFEMNKQVTVPAGVEAAHLRSIISGWGHATPNDPGGRGCAEWCFRTHHILINNVETFEHDLGPLGCAQNPINNQNPGNWQGDRAGWCPGMVVPVREDVLDESLIGGPFEFEYEFEDWTNNGYGGDAYYAISSFIVVKSNEPITQKPSVN